MRIENFSIVAVNKVAKAARFSSQHFLPASLSTEKNFCFYSTFLSTITLTLHSINFLLFSKKESLT